MPLPGFSGYVAPDCQRPMILKTAVSSRLPLAERAEIAQQRQRALAVTPDPTSSFGTGSYFLPKRHVGVTTFGLGSQAFVRSASDVPVRQKDPTATLSEGLALPFEGTTVSKEATSAYAKPSDPGFFSRVRQVERNDDDARHSLEDPKTRSGAAKNLRCTAIQNKRELDQTFAPPPLEFRPVPRTRPVNLFSKQDVSFGKAHLLTAGSTNQTDFPNPKETATIAKSIFEAKAEETRLACDRALVSTATSRDLFAGTAKASEDVVSGFMGHVPQHPSNVDRVNGASDPLRHHTKCFVNVSAPTAASQTSLTRAKIAAARAAAVAAGESVPPPQNVMNFYLSQAAESKVERQMNRVEVGRKNAVRGFFSRGVGDQDDIVADQFCLRYRPLEGVMRHGPPNSQGWISAAELHRAPRL